MFLDGFVINGEWWKHVASWWKESNNPNLLILSFEDMKRNAEKEIWRIAEFLGCELDNDMVEKIKDNTTFKVMKENPSTNFAGLQTFKQPFMRKGEVGNWKSYLTVAQNEMFDQVLAENVSDDDGLRRFLTFE